MTEAIDVAVMTYNSEKFLREALEGLFKAVNVKRLIVVDHYSTDDTLKIVKEFGAEVFSENVSLGYARQLALEQVKTPIFKFLDSDLIYEPPFDWYEGVMKRLKNTEDLASIVMRTRDIGYITEREQYQTYWHSRVDFTIRVGFTTGSTFIKREAVEGLKIPSALDAREDRYMELYILHKKCMRIEYYQCGGVHRFDYHEQKGAWTGANERILTGLRYFPYYLWRRVFTSPLKAIPPMLYYKNPGILFWNTRLWFGFLKGFLEPAKYRKMKREHQIK